MTDSNKSPETVSFSKDVIYGSIIFLLAALLVISVFTSGFGIVKAEGQCVAPAPSENVTAPAPVPDQPAPQPEVKALPRIMVGVNDAEMLGDPEAPVTLIEFSDYQCPYCARFASQAEASIKANYVDSGKVKINFRDFPLGFHPHAMPAAIATRCADDQGQYWEMHDKIFETQSSWSGLASVDDTFKGYAEDLGLDTETFNACYDGQGPASLINADVSAGQAVGVRGTPSSFLVIPKDRISREDIDAAMVSLAEQFGEGLTLYENDNDYTVMIPGAYPYSAFDTILSKVNY